MSPDKQARRRARRLAVQALYQLDYGTVGAEGAVASVVRLSEGEPPTAGELGYATELARCVEGERARIDGLIALACENWRIDRMARIDVQILRLGVAELLAGREDVPPAVAIDEAIELARAFCGEDSPRFVNGVLDGVARGLGLSGERAGESQVPAAEAPGAEAPGCPPNVTRSSRSFMTTMSSATWSRISDCGATSPKSLRQPKRMVARTSPSPSG